MLKYVLEIPAVAAQHHGILELRSAKTSLDPLSMFIAFESRHLVQWRIVLV